jgi:hypothetical protein
VDGCSILTSNREQREDRDVADKSNDHDRKPSPDWNVPAAFHKAILTLSVYCMLQSSSTRYVPKGERGNTGGGFGGQRRNNRYLLLQIESKGGVRKGPPFQFFGLVCKSRQTDWQWSTAKGRLGQSLKPPNPVWQEYSCGPAEVLEEATDVLPTYTRQSGRIQSADGRHCDPCL